MATRVLTFSDTDQGTDTLLAPKLKDILALADSNHGTDTLGSNGANPPSDYNIGVDALCINIIWSVSLSDSNNGIDGGYAINPSQYGTPTIPEGPFGSDFNDDFTGIPLQLQGGFGVLPQIWILDLSDANVGFESGGIEVSSPFGPDFNDAFAGRPSSPPFATCHT